MGVIQSAINQMLGTAGIATRLSPGFETKQELYKLGKQEKILQEQQSILGKSVDLDELMEGKTVSAQALKKAAEKEADIKARKFELSPNNETAKASLFAASAAGRGPLMTFKGDPEEIMQEQEELRMQEAMKNVANKQDAKQKQKRNFMSYLKEQPTNLGGTVGEFPLKIQKQLAKQYSPAQRKQLMDTMDKEKTNGK